MRFGVSSTGYSRTDSSEIPDVWAPLDAARSFIDAYQVLRGTSRVARAAGATRTEPSEIAAT